MSFYLSIQRHFNKIQDLMVNYVRPFSFYFSIQIPKQCRSRPKKMAFKTLSKLVRQIIGEQQTQNVYTVIYSNILLVYTVFVARRDIRWSIELGRLSSVMSRLIVCILISPPPLVPTYTKLSKSAVSLVDVNGYGFCYQTSWPPHDGSLVTYWLIFSNISTNWTGNQKFKLHGKLYCLLGHWSYVCLLGE